MLDTTSHNFKLIKPFVDLEEEQTIADVAHIDAWVDSETKAGRVPTDDDIVAELERHVCCEDTLLTYAQAGRLGEAV